ncbi:MAG: archease [Candidatus Aenigmarchaeota archaeon]|nr:archease [Candidatus Aenigmarchaeota archaeon]MBU5688841.1 archease [Candidatus Aenigmarchaeota archaeon]
MAYKFFEDVSIADVEFEATGKTLKELFESSAHALTDVQIKDSRKLKPIERYYFEKEAENIEMLLFNFLSELVLVKDAEQLLFSKFNIEILPINGKWKVKCECFGEKIDPEKHELLVDVKAVTMHKFKIEETKNGWKARVVLDI